MNPRDRYAVAVVRQGVIVGHLPSKISKVCSIFIRRGGSIECAISASRQYSKDLSQGGLEVPCVIKFKAANKEDIEKLKKCIKRQI